MGYSLRASLHEREIRDRPVHIFFSYSTLFYVGHRRVRFVSHASYRPHTSHDISQASRWAQLVVALSLAIAGICLPRRPAVYQDGQVVDAQYTCSAIQR